MNFEYKRKKVEDLTELEKQVWDSLFTEWENFNSPFLSRYFTSVVSKLVKNVYITVFYNKGKPVAFFPYQYSSLISKCWGIAQRVGSHMNDCFGIVCYPDFFIDPRTLLTASKINGIYFEGLDESQQRFGLKGDTKDVGWKIDLSEGIDAYFKNLYEKEKKYYKKTSRRRKKIERDYGALNLKFYFNLKEGKSELDRLVEYKSKQYISSGKKNIFKTSWKKALLYNLLDSPYDGCSGILAVLCAGNNWVASYYGLKSYFKLQGWFPVYNPDFRKYAPGHLLYWSIIENSQKIGVKLIDRGIGDSPVKRVLGNRQTHYLRDVWFKKNLRGIIYRTLLSLKWRFLG